MALSLNLTGIVNGQPNSAASVTTPFNQIQTFVNTLETNLNAEIASRTTGDTNLSTGVTAMERLIFGTAQAVTLSLDAFTASAKTVYIMDTEGNAASDNLNRIAGLTAGQMVILLITSNSRVITIKHNQTNGFYNNSLNDVVLNNTNLAYIGYWNGTRVVQLGNANPSLKFANEWDGINASGTPVGMVVFPDSAMVYSGVQGVFHAQLMPSLIYRNWFGLRAAAAAIQPLGIAAPSTIGTATLTASNNSQYGAMVNVATIATINTVSGIVSSTFTLTQLQHNPTWEFVFQTAADITNLRLWFGLFSAAITNVDDPATACVAFRYSTGASDTGWRGICDDGSNMSITPDTFGALTPSTLYRLRIRVYFSSVYFSVNDSAEQVLTTNLPVSSVDLGIAAYSINLAAVSKSYVFGRMMVSAA